MIESILYAKVSSFLGFFFFFPLRALAFARATTGPSSAPPSSGGCDSTTSNVPAWVNVSSSTCNLSASQSFSFIDNKSARSISALRSAHDFTLCPRSKRKLRLDALPVNSGIFSDVSGIPSKLALDSSNLAGILDGPTPDVFKDSISACTSAPSRSDHEITLSLRSKRKLLAFVKAPGKRSKKIFLDLDASAPSSAPSGVVPLSCVGSFARRLSAN
mmetsp:Transcript_4385/g.9474  ORF Transcript_4385/g.9474 Transcript_4385/m.9474 type:complete len:216 (+) Transcript_4385:389-1036(+)